MARATLPTALKLLFGDEGGYSNAKSDRGNYLQGKLVGTKFGITGATLAAHRGVDFVTAEQVKSMKIAEAEEIYLRSYWPQSGGDVLPAGLDYMAFDFGVNSGPARAIMSLQSVLGQRMDGHAGELTIAAVRRYPGGISALIKAYGAERMRYLRTLTNAKTGFPANGRGWTIRVTGKDPKGQWKDQPGVIGNALSMADVFGDRVITPISSPEGAMAKADKRDTGLLEIAKNPEVLGPLGTVLSAGGAIASGSGPIQWAFAAVMIAALAVGIWYFIRRVRESG